MRQILRRQKGSKGFTLIELLIVVAILGVLAAVVIPNVGRFLGSGQTEAQQTEAQNVQAAVSAMMVDNDITALPAPVAATNDMGAFPDSTSGAPAVGSKAGYLLFGHDKDKTDAAEDGINYVTFQLATCNYVAATDGTVTQTCP